MKRILVTGANGFVGSVLCERLTRSGYAVRAVMREAHSIPIEDKVVVGDIGAQPDWAAALRDVDCVLHLAARAHRTDDRSADAQSYFEVNELGTMYLAQAAARAGIRRFVLLSSVKVNGERTTQTPFTADDVPRPQGAYSMSKWYGERRVLDAAASSAMEAVIVRAPLVYGPGVRANFLRLLQWVDHERPLPLGAVKNRRSLVSIWNLCDLLENVLMNPAAPGRIWMVSDDEDLATPALISCIGRAMQRRVRLLPVPVALLRAVARLTGLGPQIDRLCTSLTVDVGATRAGLGWQPPVTLTDSIERTVRWYLRDVRRA